MEKEMNFYDLCAACARAVGRAVRACGRLLARMTRLTFRYWWTVCTVMALAIVAALYYSRPENLTYKMNAIALLNGPSIQQFEQTYADLRAERTLPQEAAITSFVQEKKASSFTSFRVIDCLDDGSADIIDFRRKSKPYDTLNVQMEDRLCLQFRMKVRDLSSLPQIEQGILDYLNANQPMQRSYAKYIENLRGEIAFNHSQVLKLDSLTSAYYFYNPSAAQPLNYAANGVNFYGDREVHLFLEDIYDAQRHLRQGDYRLQLATAPVVLENHFAAEPKPLNGRLKCLILFLLAGWCIGCLIAGIIDRRRTIADWLAA